MRPRGGHLGSDVSALVDGQLDAATANRWWSHVLECPTCRAAVEAETWVKRKVAVTRLAEPSARLMVNLQQMPAVSEAWAAAEALEEASARRRRAALIGAGSVSLALVGFAALSGVLPGGFPDGGPVADLSGTLVPTPSPTDPSADPTPDGETTGPPNDPAPGLGPVVTGGSSDFMSVVVLAP